MRVGPEVTGGSSWGEHVAQDWPEHPGRCGVCGLGPADGRAEHRDPDPWEPTAHTMAGGRWFAGVIERQVGTANRYASQRCDHRHSRRDLAERCAVKLADDANAVEVAGRE